MDVNSNFQPGSYAVTILADSTNMERFGVKTALTIGLCTKKAAYLLFLSKRRSFLWRPCPPFCRLA